MTGTDDLASVLTPDPEPRVVYGQGVVIYWDPETFSNIIEWQSVRLPDLPVAAGVEAFGFRPGDSVALAGVDASGRRGVMSWWIMGKLIVPGGTEGAIESPDLLRAKVLNAGQVNADSITVDGRTLDEYVEALITAQIPDADPEPPPGGQQKMRQTFAAEWSQSYRGSGSRNDFDPSPVQGFFSGTNGNQRSLIGFDSSAIQSALSAATTVVKVEVYLYFDHWYFNSGGTAVVGYHGHNSAPSMFSATTDQVRSSGWPKPGSRWVELSTSGWAAGSRTGISLGPGPSTSRTYYGSARGVGENAPPRLRITWEEPE